MDIPTYLSQITVNEVKQLSALLFGSVLQFALGSGKSFKAFVLVLLSTFFVATFLLVPLLDLNNVGGSSPIRVIVLSLSALISVEVVSITILILPKHLKKKVFSALNIEPEKKDKKK